MKLRVAPTFLAVAALLGACTSEKGGPMDRDAFWDIAGAGASDEDPTGAVAARLAGLTPAQLLAYQAHFDRYVAEAYRWDLWGACYLLEGGCSDDGFVYVRYGLIARGRSTVEAALRSADSLADLGARADLENEDLGYLARREYEKKTGKEMPRSDVAHPTSPAGAQWDFEDRAEMRRRLPRLSELTTQLDNERLEMATRALDAAREQLKPRE